MEQLITERFETYVSERHLFNKGDRVLLAVSGGADSMMLCDLFLQNGYKFGIAHCNFQLRGEASVSDEAFVREYATRCGVPFYVARFDTDRYAAEQKISIQEAARALRYSWFETVRQENDFTFIATAHHLNDHIETLLLNFFKGTGIHGLHGIRPKQGKLIRPLLFLTKEEILTYIGDHHLHYVEDASNASDKYTRNYIRHKIIPVIKERFPGIERQLDQNIRRFAEAGMLYDQAIELHRKRLVTQKGDEFFIPILKLSKTKPLATICYELFQSWNFSFEQSQQILNLLNSESGKSITSATHRLIRDRKWFIVTPLKEEEASVILIDEGRQQVDTRQWSLQLKKFDATDYQFSRNESVASVQAEKLVFPLILRPWRQGDYFYPLGLNKKKKISRFLIDQKIPLHEKEKIWVLESDKKIIWVVGMRIDHRFRLTSSAKEVLQISLKHRL